MSDPSEAPKPVKLKLSSHLPKADESTPTKRPEEIQPNPAQAIAEATATTKQKSGNPFISTLIILILLLILIGGGVGFLYFLSGKGIIKHIKNEQTIKSTKPGSETEHVNADKPNRIGEALNILRIFSFNKEPDNTKQNVHLTTKPSYETTLHGQRETKADTTTRTSKNEKTAQEKATHFLINAKVNSVRFRDQAHIILNGGHYQIGDIVDPKTGLIFTGIKERKLEFQDRNKTIYRKSF